MSASAIAERSRPSYARDVVEPIDDQYASEDMLERAIIVEDNSVIINPECMNQEDFYPAAVNGRLFLYHRVGDSEIEVYELAGDD